jgi:hypothetical protein
MRGFLTVIGGCENMQCSVMARADRGSATGSAPAFHCVRRLFRNVDKRPAWARRTSARSSSAKANNAAERWWSRLAALSGADRARDAVEITLAGCSTRDFAKLFGVRLRERWNGNFNYLFKERPNRLQELFIFLRDEGEAAERLQTDYDHIVHSLALARLGRCRRRGSNEQ